MKEIPCICNGSRGTDCDYCGGSGIIKEPFHIPGYPPTHKTSTKKDVTSKILLVIDQELQSISIQLAKKGIPVRKRKSHRHSIARQLASLSNKVWEMKRRMSINEAKVYDPTVKKIDDLKNLLFRK